jgi:hypothetical protein
MKLAATSLAASPSTTCGEHSAYEQKERKKMKKEKKRGDGGAMYGVNVVPGHARVHGAVEVVDVGPLHVVDPRHQRIVVVLVVVPDSIH